MSVYSHFQYFHSLGDEEVFRNLALFLGTSPSEESKSELLRIARETTAKEQALICLAWHRDPSDMETLFPFMLEDTQASRALPYHFRNSYGDAAKPYLERAAAEAKSEATRRETERQLGYMGHTPALHSGILRFAKGSQPVLWYLDNTVIYIL